MVMGKMLINESHKYFTNVSFHISTIRGIEPNNLPLASLTLEWAWNICDIFIKSTISKNVTITIIVLLEINLVKRTPNCPSTYGN